MWQQVLHSPVARAAFSGAIAAAVVDIHAFLTWKKFQDVEAYDWGVAVFRWVQGAVAGALTGLGMGAMIS
jgi:hypothetical protein